MSENCTHAAHREKRDSESAGWEPIQQDDSPTVVLPIHSLLLDDSPRQDGENSEHVRMLAESEDQLPPIVVHGQSMRVIDGAHRIRAAIMRGEEEIRAKIYHGTEDDAFLLAVRMNVAHGLPLTRADRAAAAVRIISSHPQWSNRMIATATGLSAGTIGKLRQRSTAQNAQSATRVGKDGRVRPIDSAAGRLRAAELLAEKPIASIRAVARQAAVSPATVRDVRQRLRAGQDPTRARQRSQGSPASAEIAATMTQLRADPSLRFSDSGRFLIQWLDSCRVGIAGLGKIAEMVPDRWVASVARLAREYARIWTELAAQLDDRWHERSS